jgi:tRNA A37 threonylcarbamoyltransferase TsaD
VLFLEKNKILIIKIMKILAFETSCDDTSIAIFEDNNLLAMDTKNQIRIHNET